MQVSFVVSATIGAEKYAPPTEGMSPIRRGIEIVTILRFRKTVFTVSIIRARTLCSLRTISKILINDNARMSLRVTGFMSVLPACIPNLFRRHLVKENEERGCEKHDEPYVELLPEEDHYGYEDQKEFACIVHASF